MFKKIFALLKCSHGTKLKPMSIILIISLIQLKYLLSKIKSPIKKILCPTLVTMWSLLILNVDCLNSDETEKPDQLK